MIVSPDALRRDVVQLLQQINAQIEEIEQTAKERGIPAVRMRDERGDWVMSSLLLAKAQAYAALVQLNDQRGT